MTYGIAAPVPGSPTISNSPSLSPVTPRKRYCWLAVVLLNRLTRSSAFQRRRKSSLTKTFVPASAGCSKVARKTGAFASGALKFSSRTEQDTAMRAAIPKIKAKCFMPSSFLPVNVRIVPTVDGFEIGYQE